MSMPRIPDLEPKITVKREDAINLLIMSIALEEIGLSHIINSEAEKVQSVLGTLNCQRVKDPTVTDLKEINYSVNETLKTVAKNQALLVKKLEMILKIDKKWLDEEIECE